MLAGPATGGDRLEGIQVHAHEVDELDLLLLGGDHVLRLVAPGEQPRVELRVQRLDAAVHDLREAGEVGDRAHLDALVGERRDAVPPVEISSTPRSASPRAKSTIPVLSDTDSSARRMRTSPGCVTRRTLRKTTARPRSGARARAAGSPAITSSGRARVGQLDGALGDDPAGVDALVDVVDGHAEDLDAVGERLLDGAQAREGRQQRRVDVDDALGEAREEGGRDAAACSRRARRARRRTRRATSAMATSRVRAVGEREGLARRRPRPARARARRRPPCRSRPPRRLTSASSSAPRFEPKPDASTPTRIRASGSARPWSAACPR